MQQPVQQQQQQQMMQQQQQMMQQQQQQKSIAAAASAKGGSSSSSSSSLPSKALRTVRGGLHTISSGAEQARRGIGTALFRAAGGLSLAQQGLVAFGNDGFAGLTRLAVMQPATLSALYGLAGGNGINTGVSNAAWPLASLQAGGGLSAGAAGAAAAWPPGGGAVM
jgi:hypothetical protein